MKLNQKQQNNIRDLQIRLIALGRLAVGDHYDLAGPELRKVFCAMLKELDDTDGGQRQQEYRKFLGELDEEFDELQRHLGIE